MILQTENKKYNITRLFSKVFLVFFIILISFTSYVFAYQPLYNYYERRIDNYDVFAESDYQMMKWMENRLPNESLILASTLDCSQYIPAITYHRTLILNPNNPEKRTEPIRNLTQYLQSQPNNIETIQLLKQYGVDYIFLGSKSFTWVEEFRIIPEKLLYSPLINEQELVAYWIYEGNEAIDFSGYENDGLIYGNTSTEDISAKLNFDGADDYIIVPHTPSLDIASDMTIEAWINITDYQDFRVIVSKWGPDIKNYYLGIWKDTGQLTFIRKGADGATYTVKSDQPLITGTWHHIVAVSRGESLELYIDGQLENSESWCGESETGSQAVHIGHNSGTRVGNQHFKGAISKPTIYSRALSFQEITTLHENTDPLSIPESPYYKVINRIENTYLIAIVYPTDSEY